MEVKIETTEKALHVYLLQVMNFRKSFLKWFARGRSPGDYPEDLLSHVTLFENLEEHFLKLYQELEPDKMPSGYEKLDFKLLQKLVKTQEQLNANREKIQNLLDKNRDLLRAVEKI